MRVQTLVIEFNAQAYDLVKAIRATLDDYLEDCDENYLCLNVNDYITDITD